VSLWELLPAKPAVSRVATQARKSMYLALARGAKLIHVALQNFALTATKPTLVSFKESRQIPDIGVWPRAKQGASYGRGAKGSPVGANGSSKTFGAAQQLEQPLMC
jgi:hypothetical protein